MIMEAYAKKLAGKKVKLENLAKEGFWIEDFNKKLYKIWSPVEEFKKEDILKRVCTPGVVVHSNLYVQKPAYVSLKAGYANVFSFDEQAFFYVSETVRKVFKLKEVKLPSLDKFPDDTLVEGLHFWDGSWDSREVTIRFDKPQTKKSVWEEFEGTRQHSFTIQLNYQKNDLWIDVAKVFETQLQLYFFDKQELEIDEDNEVKLVKKLTNKDYELKFVKRFVKSIDEIYALFEVYTQEWKPDGGKKC